MPSFQHACKNFRTDVVKKKTQTEGHTRQQNADTIQSDSLEDRTSQRTKSVKSQI